VALQFVPNQTVTRSLQYIVTSDFLFLTLVRHKISNITLQELFQQTFSD